MVVATAIYHSSIAHSQAMSNTLLKKQLQDFERTYSSAKKSATKSTQDDLLRVNRRISRKDLKKRKQRVQLNGAVIGKYYNFLVLIQRCSLNQKKRKQFSHMIARRAYACISLLFCHHTERTQTQLKLQKEKNLKKNVALLLQQREYAVTAAHKYQSMLDGRMKRRKQTTAAETEEQAEESEDEGIKDEDLAFLDNVLF
jgi:hypothetical protein